MRMTSSWSWYLLMSSLWFSSSPERLKVFCACLPFVFLLWRDAVRLAFYSRHTLQDRTRRGVGPWPRPQGTTSRSSEGANTLLLLTLSSFSSQSTSFLPIFAFKFSSFSRQPQIVLAVYNLAIAGRWSCGFPKTGRERAFWHFHGRHLGSTSSRPGEERLGKSLYRVGHDTWEAFSPSSIPTFLILSKDNLSIDVFSGLMS